MRVLVAPLDWGLGHATRCIPLIDALERAGHTVIACAGGPGLRLLRAEFPELLLEPIPGHSMRYTRRRALLPLRLFAQLPAFLLSLRRDGRTAARLARKHRAGLILSDGRHGFRCAGVPSVFLTHQLEIPPPGPPWLRRLLAPGLRWLNRRALRRFAAVWVPDFPGEPNLAGELAHPHGAGAASGSAIPPVEYIRPLCRFRSGDAPEDNPLRRTEGAPGVDVLALVSGPEPQRSLLERKLRAALEAFPGTRVLVRGLPGAGGSKDAPLRPGELNVFDHLPGGRLQSLLESADSVICRSGYTTLMELAGLGRRNVLLVPTPGQPEQEYLARHARRHGFAAWQDQDALDVEGGLRAALALPGFAVLKHTLDRDESSRFDLAAWISDHPLLQPAASASGVRSHGGSMPEKP